MHVYIWIIIDFYAFLKLYLFLDFLLKKNSNMESKFPNSDIQSKSL